jgi:mycoredoxin
MADKICVYGTIWCHDTIRSRNCLKRLGVDYNWFDVDADENAAAFVRKVNNGSRSVPTIVFPDGTILVEPDDSELEAKCRD